MKKKNKLKVQASGIKHFRLSYLFFLVVIPLVLYFRVVNLGMTELDDDTIIYGINNLEGSKINLKEAFTHDAMMSDKGDSFYRPLQTVSIMVDAEIGGSETWVYHFTNLILHILTIITLFFFLIKIGIRDEISFLLSLLFAVNPLFTNAVAWIPARGDLLLCLFCLISFMSFMQYFKNGKRIYVLIHGLAFVAAMFSKETAILLPVILLSYLYYVQRKSIRIKEIIPFLVIWSFTFVAYFMLRLSILKINHSASQFGIIPFIKNLPVIPIIISKFFIPYDLNTMPAYDSVSIIIGIIFMIVLAAAIIRVVKGDKKTIIWGVLWFIAFSIPPMLFRSIDVNLGIEKYNYLDFRAYLPVTGLLVIFGILINEKFSFVSLKKMLVYFIPVLIIYSVIAFNYTKSFSDSISFYSSAINANPKNVINLLIRGTIYYGQGNSQMAALDFDNADRIEPSYSLPYYNKGLLYESLNDHDLAEKSFSLALKYDTLYKGNNYLQESSYLNLSSEKIILRKYPEAISILRKAVTQYPANSTIHFNLGVVYNYVSEYDSALIEFNKGIESEKNSPEFYSNRGMTKIKLNDFNGAIEDLSKAINLKQDFGDAWYFRGLAYSKLNNNVQAEADWTQARKLGFNGSAQLQ
ncbi:MAG: glycosyltransferase family 39 protein [Ignavibacteriaceae bacterium]|nr:glycosyltransferase family 39 protein [Ignavibacteriaceae bacterium]